MRGAEEIGGPGRYCGACGAEVRSGNAFCVSCGGRLPPAPEVDAGAVPPPDPWLTSKTGGARGGDPSGSGRPPEPPSHALRGAARRFGRLPYAAKAGAAGAGLLALVVLPAVLGPVTALLALVFIVGLGALVVWAVAGGKSADRELSGALRGFYEDTFLPTVKPLAVLAVGVVGAGLVSGLWGALDPSGGNEQGSGRVDTANAEMLLATMRYEDPDGGVVEDVRVAGPSATVVVKGNPTDAEAEYICNYALDAAQGLDEAGGWESEGGFEDQLLEATVERPGLFDDISCGR